MSVYEQLCEARNKTMFVATPARDEKMKVLSQLMSLAFNNRLDPDKLPNVFTINNINCANKETFQEVLEDFGFKILSVEIVKTDFLRGKTFEVTLV